jgi:hypothetical protein
MYSTKEIADGYLGTGTVWYRYELHQYRSTGTQSHTVQVGMTRYQIKVGYGMVPAF